jgi:hypothetical protein
LSIPPATRSLSLPPPSSTQKPCASLTPKQVHAFCYHVELLIRARVYDAQTFTLLTDPQSIMAIGLRFMTSKVMERVPVLDWKVGWEVSLILEALIRLRHLTIS